MIAAVGLALVVAGGVAVSVALAVSTTVENSFTSDAPCQNRDPDTEPTRHHCVACRPELALAYAPEQ